MDNVRSLVLGCLLLALSSALIVRENVVFRKTNEISVSRSMWTVTLVLDLKPYQSMLDQSLENIKEINKFLETRKTFFRVEPFQNHLRTLEDEVTFLRKSREKVVNSFNQFEVFNSRNKRSL